MCGFLLVSSNCSFQFVPPAPPSFGEVNAGGEYRRRTRLQHPLGPSPGWGCRSGSEMENLGSEILLLGSTRNSHNRIIFGVPYGRGGVY